MRRLIVLVLIGVAAWYGWNHWAQLRLPARDEAVIENQTGQKIYRVRLIVGDHTDVKESIPAGASATIPFHVTQDGPLGLKWQYERSDVDQAWSGGQVTAGPLRTRHHLAVSQDGGVVWTSERLTASAH